jgi:hypothetical protein
LQEAHDIYTDTYPSQEKVPQTSKSFQNGRSQAVRLPKEYGFTGKEVFIRKVGTGEFSRIDELKIGDWK